MATEHSHRDIADLPIHQIGVAAVCSRTVTFDKCYARLDGVELVE